MTTELMVGAERCFFHAMQEGYVVGPEKGTIPELPRSKTVTFEEDNFRLIDCWFTTPGSNRSWGFTHIYYRESEASAWVLIWAMQYWGEYEPEAIEFLKKALAASYLSLIHERFDGCRGPASFVGHGMVYQNIVDNNGDGADSFRFFSGVENICTERGESLGYHRYRGQSMLPD